jgi:hypothetical protein
MTTPPAHDSIELPASIRDIQLWVDRYVFGNRQRRELAMFSHGGRMYVCRDADVEALRAWLLEAAVERCL